MDREGEGDEIEIIQREVLLFWRKPKRFCNLLNLELNREMTINTFMC